jgi:hypothetical protein
MIQEGDILSLPSLSSSSAAAAAATVATSSSSSLLNLVHNETVTPSFTSSDWSLSNSLVYLLLSLFAYHSR